MLHVRPQNQVSVAFPRFKLMLLRRAHRSGYNLKDVLGSAAAAVLNSNRNSEDTVRANLARGDRGHLGNEASISQAASADLDRFKEAGESAAGANRIDQRPLRKNDGIECCQIGGHHGHGNAQLFKGACREDAVH